MSPIRALFPVLSVTAALSSSIAVEEVPFSPTRVSVPGSLRLQLREQKEVAPNGGEVGIHESDRQGPSYSRRVEKETAQMRNR